MFSGIGGFELGIERATNNSWECVGYSEIEPRAIKIYKEHYPEHKNYGDATQINAKELPEFDLLVGGFPCQSFSISGLRKGFNDTRGTLFFDIARIIKEKRPKYILLENVKGLLSHDKGRTIKIILSALEELDYDTETMVFDGINFKGGRRKRIFMFGTYRNKKDDVRKRIKQTIPILAMCCQRSRITTDSIQESRGSSERIIRKFAKLPYWMDSWDSVYIKEKMCGERSDS